MTATAMDLHLVVGEAGLFGPGFIPAVEIAQAAGERVQPLSIGWLDAGQACANHDSLLERANDHRVLAAAYALANDFAGAQAEPCLILPGLASPAGRDACIPVLDELTEALRHQGVVPRLVLHALALPEQDDPVPGLRTLAEALCAAGLNADLANPPVVPLETSTDLSIGLRRNFQAAEIAQEIAVLALDFQLRTSAPERLIEFCELRLKNWGEHGLFAAPMMRPEQRRQLASMLLHGLLSANPDAPQRPDTEAR